MTTLTDARFTYLRGVPYTGSTADMLLQFWQDTATVGETLNDAKLNWLIDKGFVTGALSDRWFAYLRGAGLFGTLNDMETEFWDTL